MYIWSIFLLSIFLSYVFNAIGYMYMNRKMKTCQVKLNSSFNINCEVILKKKCGILNASPTPHCSLDENYTVYTVHFTLHWVYTDILEDAIHSASWLYKQVASMKDYRVPSTQAQMHDWAHALHTINISFSTPITPPRSVSHILKVCLES